MKEGPVEDYANRDAVLKLLRFASTKAGTPEENVSLADYVAACPRSRSTSTTSPPATSRPP